MPADVAPTQRMTAAEYLAWERLQPDKHEYLLGEVFAMAGGSIRHSFLAGAATSELRLAFRDAPCRVLTSDTRIAIGSGERYVYADAVVVCGEVRTEPGTSDLLSNPSVIVEVLSESTEKYDRGDKWETYRRVPSLTDYLLVSQLAPHIEHFQREADGSWRYRVLGAGDSVTLATGATLSVDSVYDGAFELAAG
jgi:Uma2 family endonuclease